MDLFIFFKEYLILYLVYLIFTYFYGTFFLFLNSRIYWTIVDHLDVFDVDSNNFVILRSIERSSKIILNDWNSLL